MSDVMSRLAVPVIFANGEDDDLPGLIAAFENRPVQYLDQTIASGQPVIVRFKKLWLSKYLVVEGPGGAIMAVVGDLNLCVGAPAIAMVPAEAIAVQRLYITHCDIMVGPNASEPPKT